ncbi:MAG: hypothetical protein NT159_08210 [Proteobacteria bacterium]|nr:hypothetical protein [Pseudomonadota bacterium]
MDMAVTKREQFPDLGLMCKILADTFGAIAHESPNAQTFSIYKKDGVLHTTIPTRFMPRPGISAERHERLLQILRGGLCHENVGHGRHTDFDFGDAWMQKLRKNQTAQLAFIKAVANIGEDRRIEDACGRVYPGAKRLLSEMVGALDAEGFFGKGQPAGMASAITQMFNRVLRTEAGQPLDPRQTKTAAMMVRDALGDELTERIMGIVRNGATGLNASTQTTCKAAEDVAAILAQAAQEQRDQEEEDGGGGQGDDHPEDPPEQQQGQGQKGEGQQEDSSQTGNDPSPGDEAGEQGSSAGPQGGAGQSEGEGVSGPSQGDPEEGGEPAKGKSGGGKGSGGNVDADAIDAALNDKAVQGDLADVISKALGGLTTTNHSSVSDLPEHKACVGHFRPDSVQASLAARLRSRLAEHLRSRVEDEDGSETDHGLLVPSRIVDGLLGDRMIFEEEGAEGEGLNTAMEVLVDCSGSMSGLEEASALAALYACGAALGSYEMQGVAFAIHSFNERLTTLKEFNEPWMKRKGALEAYCSGGSTKTPHAIRTVLPALCKRREKRKILFLITDGDTGVDAILAPILEVGRRNRAGRVEFRVLLIGTRVNATCFDQVAYAAPGEDLQKAIFGTLKACL